MEPSPLFLTILLVDRDQATSDPILGAVPEISRSAIRHCSLEFKMRELKGIPEFTTAVLLPIDVITLL